MAAVGGGDDVVLAGGEVDPQRAQDLWFVVDDQDPGHRRSHWSTRSRAAGSGAWSGAAATTAASVVGSRRVMVRPPPGVVSGSRLPPMASARQLGSGRFASP